MRQNEEDQWTPSDIVVGVGFFGSILLGQVLPFAVGIAVVARWLPCGAVRAWAHGWAEVLGAIVLFLVFFFGSMMTDKLVAVLLGQTTQNSVVKRIGQEVAGILLLMALLYAFFEDWRALLPAALLVTALSVSLNLLISKLIDWDEQRHRKE
ncbi:hypothetical protein KIM372_09320 [Bombiscardovia nodaiensis]|uniref:Integral membrane protein n=1 Tax=Bombiscardovia nodaiensis TaxID=2932181 RepID=A0ABN6SA33_9BIFI|nr:hypothetical protein KIM372_09320 [Bombiscardovia nodaiensis]